MKGLAIEHVADTSHPLRKKSLASASNLAIAIPKGFQDNLLSNSLTSKLKQRRGNGGVNNKENASKNTNSKPPKHTRKTSTKDNSGLEIHRHDNGILSRTGSGTSSVHSELKKAKNDREYRVDSASSDKLPRLSARKDNTSSRASRRTNSADAFIGVCSGSLGSGRLSRISASTSFYPSTDSTGLAFDSSGADYTIKVIKRDGVFQPIDKYAPGRHMSRDLEHASRGLACDYELFTLPISEDNAADANSPSSQGKYQNLPVSRGGKSDNSRKSMKVSWCTVMENEHSHNGPHDGLDSRVDTNATPVINFTVPRPNNCKDNLAFKRPIYSSGKSRIKSIGVKWTVPSVASNDNEEIQRQIPSTCSSASARPMWSWLITPEPANSRSSHNKEQQQQPQRQRSSTRIKSVGQLSRASKSKESPTPSSLGRSASMFDIRTQHCRDVHPVATAMDRQGTSITKTKWHVPSSTSSTLDAKQVAMERLQMVKRPGKKILYDSPNQRNDNLKYQNGDENNADDNRVVDYSNMIDEYKEMMMMNEMREMGDDGVTTTTTTRRDDTNSSPTKSMSTYH